MAQFHSYVCHYYICPNYTCQNTFAISHTYDTPAISYSWHYYICHYYSKIRRLYLYKIYKSAKRTAKNSLFILKNDSKQTHSEFRLVFIHKGTPERVVLRPIMSVHYECALCNNRTEELENAAYIFISFRWKMYSLNLMFYFC